MQNLVDSLVQRFPEQVMAAPAAVLLLAPATFSGGSGSRRNGGGSTQALLCMFQYQLFACCSSLHPWWRLHHA